MSIARMTAVIAAGFCLACAGLSSASGTRSGVSGAPTGAWAPGETAAPAPDGAATADHAEPPSANVRHELTAADAEAWLDGLLPHGLKSGDIAGAVVSIAKDGKVLFQSGYGYADVEKKRPMDPERVMTRIGSTSKLFTWTAVMQLVEQGKLDLNRNVDDYLDFKVSPKGQRPITLLDLMNHRGGFEEGLKDVLSMDPHTFQSTETYLKKHPRPLLFAPGTVPAYSNYGAALAGYIVQRVSGEPFERYVENHIFLPLGMQHSTFTQPLPKRFLPMMSQGYRTASTPPQPYELVVTAPAGSVASTAADMARFMLAQLQDGRLGDYEMLDRPTAELMQSPSETAPPGFGTMAHGFFHEIRNGRPVIGHGGDTIFFHTEFELLPQEGVGIFYSFNSRGRDNAVYGLRKELLDQFIDRYFPQATPPSEPKALPSAAGDASKIAGRYRSSRRVEHGFMSVFYLLQQAVIRVGPDGTVVTPKSLEPGEARLIEVAPDVWREIGGTRELALREINGVKTVLDSEDPSSVLQAVPAYQAAPLNLTVLGGSLLVLALSVALWPVGYFVRRHYRRALPYPPEASRPRIVLRVAALYGVLWLVGWVLAVLPLLGAQYDFYSSAHDPLIRTLQLAGVLLLAVAAGALWSVGRLWHWQHSKWVRIGNGLIAAGLLGLVWIGVVGGLISFRLNY
jgi:CubicO group peptidase (beta-lactamase class C family)